MKCLKCGGNLQSIGGAYKCLWCGATFDESDFASTRSVKGKVEEKATTNSGADVFEKNINGVLEIQWNYDEYNCAGSGFLISDNGYAITNTHVVTVDDGRCLKTVNVSVSGKNTTADVIALGDDEHGLGRGVDLALLKLNTIPKEAKSLKVADFGKVRVGEKVYVIGNSLGCGTCITSGIVSDKIRSVSGKKLMMTDCAVNGGNSGGPIFNEDGEVIGAIVSGIEDAEGMNFAIPVNQIIDFVNGCDVNVKLKVAGKKATHKNYKRVDVRCPQCKCYNTLYDEDAKIHWCGDCDCEW